jgi:hypothetical protein
MKDSVHQLKVSVHDLKVSVHDLKVSVHDLKVSVHYLTKTPVLSVIWNTGMEIVNAMDKSFELFTQSNFVVFNLELKNERSWVNSVD